MADTTTPNRWLRDIVVASVGVLLLAAGWIFSDRERLVLRLASVEARVESLDSIGGSLKSVSTDLALVTNRLLTLEVTLNTLPASLAGQSPLADRLQAIDARLMEVERKIKE